MRILGLVASTHDSGLALLKDGLPELVIEEERLNRQRHTKAYPRQALAHAFGNGLTLDDIDVITTPWDVAKLRKSFAKIIFGGLPSSLSLVSNRSHELQDSKIVFLNQVLSRRLRRQFNRNRLPPIVNVGHHDSHAAVFFVSPFEEAAVLVMDGFGDDASTSVYAGRDNRLTRRWHTSITNSIGMVYTFVTNYLGFGGFAGEGKVMALAAYGGPTYVERFRDVVRLTDEGGYAVNMDYFSFDAYGELKPFKRKFFEVFGPPRARHEPLDDRHRDIAAALQTVTEEVILHVVRGLEPSSPSKSLVFSGGVALNCVANARILERTGFKRVWVPPVASDSGAPLGSALWHYHQTLQWPRHFELDHPYYGVGYSEDEIGRALEAAGLEYERLGDAALVAKVARDLADGRVVGWFNGRFEIGPRALGARSILADPTRAGMRDIINNKIKQREPFRPFAPAVLAERASEFFELSTPDPFMTIAPYVRPEKRKLVPAIVHADGSARVQTVDRRANALFYDLIKAFGEITGVPMLLNTSFNRHEPIVARPEEAIACFLRTGLDVIAIGGCYSRRSAQRPRIVQHEQPRQAPRSGGALGIEVPALLHRRSD